MSGAWHYSVVESIVNLFDCIAIILATFSVENYRHVLWRRSLILLLISELFHEIRKRVVVNWQACASNELEPRVLMTN